MVGEDSDRQTIVYIAGLGHSGTTILGLLLSQTANAVSLGEVSASLRISLERINKAKYTCTCGSLIPECEFWGDVMAERTDTENNEQLRALVLKHFRKQFPGKVLVDSSKFVDHDLYTGWMADKISDQVDIKVIHIVRDYRGWALSRYKAYARKGRKKFLYLHCLAWWLRNMARARKLKAWGLPVLTISYESLVFNRDRELERIADFAGLDFNGKAADTQNMQAHDCHGNNLRRDQQNYSELRYDYRWMHDSRFIWLSPALIPVHLYWKAINNWSAPTKTDGITIPMAKKNKAV